MRPPIHRDVMCNTNRYKDQTSNGYHDFSLLDKNMIASICCLYILSKEINLSTEVINTNFLASTQDEKVHQVQALISLYRDHSKEASCPECAPLSQEVYKKWEEAISTRRSTPSKLGSGVASFGKVCRVANPTPTAPSPGKIQKQITEEMQAFEDELSPCLRI